ncbi:3-keto-5-aminohexanoate cleavage protein [Caldimonas thermodepolymerans]|uniref:3-keto-5-aminohexanoate cleavage protein n=1 Tax=Caldimonas thermodepolymerans TaxID=215580 RepID=UPI002235F483|nr:3-keto-5-aminohexanoate cleavage protein [Caldimonas thermodepolymerans]UZG45291.1 3-keto-5-aminohexanoate cleavage protein [Caldimonas thermodepolymerans]
MDATTPATWPDATRVIAPVPIGVAPNGARRTQRDHPALPMTAAELAECAAACEAAGASWFHVHVRDDAGAHTLDAARYREAFAAIRERVGPGMVLQMTTEAVGRYSPQEQIAAVEAVQPEAVSVAVRELLADDALLPRACAFLEAQREAGTAVQFIVYDPADLQRLVALHGPQGRLHGAPEVLFVLGSYAQRRAGDPRELLAMLAVLPPGWGWSVCAFGPTEFACLTAAAALGGGVRIGFENNVHLPDGSPATDNAMQVSRMAQTLDALGIPRASWRQARERFFRR